jgi:hypothetical protein
VNTTHALLPLGLAALLATGPARAQEPKKDAPAAAASKADEASQRFKSGVAFYKDKDFTAAMVEFKKAYELLPNYNVLFNIGQTARELKDYATALTAFEKYLAEGGAKVPAARRKDVQGSIDDLKKKVGKLKIVTTVDGAEILVDDVSVGTAPLPAPIVVNVGRHKLSATLSGFTPVQRVVDVASMDESTVTLELAKPDAPPPPPIEPKAPAPKKTDTRLAAWITLGATGASLVVTGIMGGLAVSARSGLKDALGTFPGNAQKIADAQSKTRGFAVATDVLTGLTIAGAAATGVLFVLAPKAEKSEKPSPTVGISPMGVVVQGSF